MSKRSRTALIREIEQTQPASDFARWLICRDKAELRQVRGTEADAAKASRKQKKLSRKANRSK